ncbi:hypothetical protein [Pseudothermotoga sp.]
MKCVLVFVAVVTVLFFASCSAILPSGPKPEDLAKDLADKIMELVQSGEWRTYQKLREIIYVASEDTSNLDVEGLVLQASDFIVFSLCEPSTPTSISVAGVSKIETKLIAWIIDEKPTFVKDVYSVTYVCTRNASTTVVELPMMIVQENAYYFAVWIQETDGATELKYYPTLVPFL